MRRSRRFAFGLVVASLLAVPVLAAGPSLAVPADEAIPPPVAPTATADPLDNPVDTEPFNLQGVAVAALQKDPPFFQLNRAPLAVAPNEVGPVTEALSNAGTPMFTVILPGSTGYAVGFSREVSQAMGLPGTYLSIIGTTYDAYSTEIDAQPILTRAYTEQHTNGTAAVITRFAELSGQAAQGPLPTPDQIAWRPTLIFVGVVLAVGVGFLLVRSKAKPQAADSEPDTAVDVPAP